MSGDQGDMFFSDTGIMEGHDLHPSPSPTGFENYDRNKPPAPYVPPSGYMDNDNFAGMPQSEEVMPPPTYTPRPTDPYTLEEKADIIQQVQSDFEAVVTARAEKEAAQAAEVKKKAADELDGFYDKRTDEVARRQALSREEEEHFLKDLAASIEESSSNPWARICDLVDLKGGIVPTRRDSKSRGKRPSLDTRLEEDDVYRATEKMRSLMIQMKVDTSHKDASDEDA